MIYLDSAATTLQKPPEVAQAVGTAMERMASPGRGAHPPAMLAAETVFACREAAARLFHVRSPEQVVFTFNATHALNLAIKSVVRPGDTVLISGWEHNAVTRPLYGMPGVRVKVAAGGLFEPEEFLAQMEQQLTGEVRAVVCTHVSNVFGCILPIGAVASLCRRRGVALIVDASQSAGCLPIDQEELGAAFIAMPGHKGLYGPQGTGLLLCGERGKPLLEGGTGSESLHQSMPGFLPDRLEAGTHNVPGIAGLLEGLRFVEGREEEILRHETALLAQAAKELSRLPRLTVFAAGREGEQAGVLSFLIEGMDSEGVGEALGGRGIAVRAGLHCAPLAHRSAGTLETGTVRASFSAFNTQEEVRALVAAVAELVGEE